MGSPDLTEVPVEDLLGEVQRRMLCALKPQKRVILIGTHRRCTLLSLLSQWQLVSSYRVSAGMSPSSARCMWSIIQIAMHR